MALYGALGLSLLMPFADQNKDFNIKLILLLVIGAYSWISFVASKIQKIKWNYLTYLITALVLLLITIAIYSRGTINLFGAFYSPISALSLLAIIGLALNTSFQKPEFIARAIFFVTALVAFLAFPYDIWRYHGLAAGRVSGTIAQSNSLAVYISAGLIIGFYWLVSGTYKNKKYLLIAVEAYMLFMTILTQTRFVIVLLGLMALTYFVLRIKEGKKIIFIALATLLFAFGSIFVVNNRQINQSALEKGVNYRLHLQATAFSGEPIRAVQVNGTNKLLKKLECNNLNSSNDLVLTCFQGFIFSSYHNQYLDRLVQFGWIFGLGYFLLISYGVTSIFEQRHQAILLTLGCAFLLTALYYFTNVTTIEIEILLWILLLQGLSKRLINS
ncbi:hypothetical protein EBZ57_02780 [bacterium]|nr:hypothetical protein [bacterium]